MIANKNTITKKKIIYPGRLTSGFELLKTIPTTFNSNEIDSTDTKLNVQINYRAKRAKWYINKFGGGFSKDAKRSMTKVIYPNGQVKRTRNFGLFKIYPKVRRGSEIRLALKDNKDLSPDERKDNAAQRRERIDRIIDSSTALLSLATAAITTMILADRL